MWTEYLDNGHYKIKTEDAKRLNNGRLPRPGFEALVKHGGKHWWLSMSRDYALRPCYTIRDAGRWYLDDKGNAVLGTPPKQE